MHQQELTKVTLQTTEKQEDNLEISIKIKEAHSWSQKQSLRQSAFAPRKVRLVLDLVRGKKVGEALGILEFTTKSASLPVAKVIKSAAANAEHNYGMNVEDLVVSQAFANEGPTLKRFRPRAKGAASSINKRTSHITIVLSDNK